MSTGTRAYRGFMAAAAAAMLFPAAAKADIAGFGNFANWTVNINDTGAAPTVAPGLIHLINNTSGEARSVIYDTPQSITGFTASFTYQNTGASDAYGATFILENATTGANAVGFNSTRFGYGFTGRSVAITLEMTNPSLSGFYVNGNIGGGSSSTSPVDLHSGDPINITLSYDGAFLNETLVDVNTSATYHASFLENLPSILGANSAYVGVTASSNSADGTQTFSNFSFGAPEPASVAIMGVAGALLLARRRRRAY